MCAAQGTRTNEWRRATGYLGEFVVIAGSFNDDGTDNPTVGTAQATFEARQAGEASPTPSAILVDALTTLAIVRRLTPNSAAISRNGRTSA